MRKKILIALLGLFFLGGMLAGIKALQFMHMAEATGKLAPAPETVTAYVVKEESWETRLSAVGSVEAVQGVYVAAELPGKVVAISFQPGAPVERGEILLRQDISSEQARLPGAEAAVELARIDRDRLQKLLDQRMVSPSEYDRSEASYRQALAEAEYIRATIEKKTVRAPFSGRLGVRLVNLGQILKEGDSVVSLQTLDPIFINFHLPQKQLALIDLGYQVRVSSDSIPDAAYGQVTVINPDIDPATRNVLVQVTSSNPSESLRPGMHVTVEVILPEEKEVIAIPATAVLYAPYGNSVFIVEKQKNDKGQEQALVVRQQFVRLGAKRGDLVSVLSGVKTGETVVSTGVFKLRNGQQVVIDNALSPDFKERPRPEEG